MWRRYALRLHEGSGVSRTHDRQKEYTALNRVDGVRDAGVERQEHAGGKWAALTGHIHLDLSLEHLKRDWSCGFVLVQTPARANDNERHRQRPVLDERTRDPGGRRRELLAKLPHFALERKRERLSSDAVLNR
jgi:hypothetical protein